MRRFRHHRLGGVHGQRLVAVLRVTAVVVTLCALVAACGSPAATVTPVPATPSAATSAAPSAAAPSDSSGPSAGDSTSGAVVPDSPVAGVVVSVDPAAGTPRGFTLRSSDGETVVFVLGTLEADSDVTAADLSDRKSTAAPILVFFKPDNAGNLVVYNISNAG